MLSIFVSLEVIYWKSSIALQWGRKVKVVTIKTIYWFYIPITYFYFHRALLTLESHERFPYPLDENSPSSFSSRRYNNVFRRATVQPYKRIMTD